MGVGYDQTLSIYGISNSLILSIPGTASKYHTNSMLNGFLHVVPCMNYEKMRLFQVNPISFCVKYKFYLNFLTDGARSMSGKLVVRS